MRQSRLLLLPALLLFLTSSGQTQRSLTAQVGDLANGEVLSEVQGHLLLNPKPCSAGRPDSVIDFHEPYKKRPLGNKTCPNGRNYMEVSVEQQ
jgi:hypothetical protein